MPFKIKITNGRDFLVDDGNTILESALDQGIDFPHGCRTGNCGACKSKKIYGDIEMSPYSEFALDARFKLELLGEILASKEMYLGKYYIEREKWIPAINRYKNVINNYETSIYVEEALHRLVEIHYKIGLVEESKKYAALLGYNYQSSDWYRESYKVFNKNYEKISKRKKAKNKKSTLDKIKSLLKNEK